MPDTLTTNSPIIAAYRAATPGSAAASERASRLFPSGVTDDSRYIEPYGLYITRAEGPRKWISPRWRSGSSRPSSSTTRTSWRGMGAPADTNVRRNRHRI